MSGPDSSAIGAPAGTRGTLPALKNLLRLRCPDRQPAIGRPPNSNERLNTVWMSTRRLVLVFSLLLAAPIGAAGAPFPASPAVTDSLGINLHYHPTDPPQILDMIQAEGVRLIYTDFEWPTVERIKGQYDFSASDKMYHEITRRGMRANFLLNRNNPLYGTDPTQAAWLQGYAHFAAAAAAHFKGVVWEFWGEADNPPNWVTGTYSPSQYMAMVRAAAPAMRRADPTCTLVAPGTTGVNLSYLKTCIQEGLLDLVDGVGVDPYRQNPYHAHSSNGTPESLVSDYAELRAYMRQYGGKTLPIVCSELGWSSYAGDGGLTPQAQGDYLARMFLVNISQGVPLSNWYSFQDAASQGTTNPEYAYGTARSDLTPKPAYQEMQLPGGLVARNDLFPKARRRKSQRLAAGLHNAGRPSNAGGMDDRRCPRRDGLRLGHGRAQSHADL